MPRRKRRGGDVVYVDPYMTPPGYGFGGAYTAEPMMYPPLMSIAGGNQWQQFLHDHGHLGLSQPELAALYHRTYGAGARVAGARLAGANIGGAKKRKPRKPRGGAENPWIDFIQQHAGQGYTREDLRKMYYQQR